MSFTFETAKQILPRYDGYMIDLWGVVHDGFQAYPGVVDCLNQLIQEQKPLIFLSNAPRPGTVVMKKLVELGIQVSPKMILSSGDAVRHQLEHRQDEHFKQLGKSFYHLGANRNQDILADLNPEIRNLETTILEKADFILLTAYIDDDEDIDQHDELLEQAFTLRIPVVCANPDKGVIHGKRKRYCAGVIAEKYENLGGKVFYYGKPHKMILDFALMRFRQTGITDKQKILIVGDTLETDIQSAKNIGIDSALVLTGNTGALLADKKTNQTEMDFLNSLFQQEGITPTWVIPSLA